MIPPVPEASALRLYDFQTSGVNWLRSHPRGILADDPGAGKTPQALMAIHPTDRVLVVTTKSTQRNWVLEAQRWRPDLEARFVDRRTFRLPYRNEIVVARWSSLPDGLEFDGTLILDEVHKTRNPMTWMAKRAQALARHAQRVWGLSGTPIITRPEDLWWELDGIGLGDCIGGWETFNRLIRRDRCGRAWGIWPTLQELIAPWVLRRTKAEILPYLPKKTHGVFYTPIKDSNLLIELDRVLRDLGGEEELASILDGVRGKMEAKRARDSLATTRCLLAMAKLRCALDWVLVKEALGQPLIVTSVHRSPIEALGQRDGWPIITGEVSGFKRQVIIRLFQMGYFKGLGMTGAGGEGITLTRAAEMLRIDLDWSPALNLQMEDRIHRAGQRREVFILDLVADHAVDGIVHRSIQRKEEIMRDAGLLSA